LSNKSDTDISNKNLTIVEHHFDRNLEYHAMPSFASSK
jgi:hypothetical protein